MKYHDIEKTSLVNGSGIRVVLWVSGCNHYCKGCQNPITWDPNDGKEFGYDEMLEICDRMDKDYCDGITLSGGDPMYPGNREEILGLVKYLKNRYGSRKTIWIYTGYTMDEIKDDPILKYVDVVVDGPYIEEQRNVNRQWCGSENQRIWRKKEGVWTADPPLYSTDDYEAKTGQGCCQ